MKRFLLFCGDTYYPLGGWEDFVGDYDTLLDALKHHRGDQLAWWHVVDTGVSPPAIVAAQDE